jgi:hypothetical protein
MELGFAVLAVAVLIPAAWWLRRELRALRVEWRVRRGLRGVLAQAA